MVLLCAASACTHHGGVFTALDVPFVDLAAHPRQMCRNAEGFVGLCNGSATCYMNAVFQQLFMQPAVRDLILSAPEVPQPARRESVFYQLQVNAAS